MNFRIEAIEYIKEKCQQERANVDIMWENGEIEHITGPVDFYINGETLKSCVNGEFILFSIQQQISILELILAERLKLIDGHEKKTYSAWHEAALDFGDYCFPGDIVDDEIVDYFVDCMPPITLRRTCTQCGEPHGMEVDERGVYKETYITFRREDGKWIFDGYCFAGENVNRDTKGSHLERMLKRLKAAPKTLRLKYIGRDSWGRYVYKDERDNFWKHLDCNSPIKECQRRGDKLYSSCNNAFDGEPDSPMRKGIEIEYVEEA